MIDAWDLPPEKVGWGIVGVAVFALVIVALYSLLGGVVLGLFLYYATRPAYQWLDEYVDHPDANAAVTLLLVGAPILLVAGYATVVAVGELDRFVGQAGLEQFRTALRPYVDVAELTSPQTILSRLDGRLTQISGFLNAVLVWSLRIFVAFTVAFYLLRDDKKIAQWARRSFHGEYGVVSFLEGVDDDLTTIYTGNLITIGATGLIAVLVYYGLSLIAPSGIGVPFPVLLGLVTGVATLIPAVGMKLVYVPYTAYLAWQSVTGGGALWFPAVFFVVTLLAVDSFPDIVVRSYVSKGEINMGLIMLGYVLGAYAFGWYGVFLAPVVLVVFLHFAHRVFPNLLDRADVPLVTDDGRR